MPTVPDAEIVPPVDSVPVSERIVATPPPSAMSALMSLMAMPARAATKRAPDVAHRAADDRRAEPAADLMSTSAAPVSDRPCAASRSVRKAKRHAAGEVERQSGAAACRPSRRPSASGRSRRRCWHRSSACRRRKSPLEGQVHRAEAGRARLRRLRALPVDREADRRVGRLPVTLAVPEIVPAADEPGRKALAIEAGTPDTVALRSSVAPAVPETVALPPPMSSASLSSVVVPSAISTVEGRASFASTPRTVAWPEASSIVVLPSASLHAARRPRRNVRHRRAAVEAGPGAVLASVTSTSCTTVAPEVTVPARIVPARPAARYSRR